MPRRAMEIVADVCAALDFSHRHGIMHRDIKPANVMITRTGAVKVMDFGIARAVADNAATVTQTAAVIGTAQYLSPEQARGETVDARSDVYSTGVLLFELITGAPPFTGDSPVAVAYQHVRENPPPPSTINPDVPPELDAIVLKAMAKNPANRYQSAGEMRADLIRAINGRPVEAEPVMTADEVTTVLGGPRTGQYPAAATATRVTGRPPTAPPKKDRSPWFWVGIIAAALLVIAAGDVRHRAAARRRRRRGHRAQRGRADPGAGHPHAAGAPGWCRRSPPACPPRSRRARSSAPTRPRGSG